MMTKDEMARVRRQMHRRIRVVLAQRRVTTMSVSLAERGETTGVRDVPRQRADDDPSGEPTPQD